MSRPVPVGLPANSRNYTGLGELGSAIGVVKLNFFRKTKVLTYQQISWTNLKFCARTGGLDILQIITLEETKIEAVLKQRNTGREMNISVWAEAGERFVERIMIHVLGEGGDAGQV